MKIKILLLIILIFGFLNNTFSQKSDIELTFTAVFDGQYVPLDSILIENLTRGGDTMLIAPDTTLSIDLITKNDNHNPVSENNFSVRQNYPNPFTDQTTIEIVIPDKDVVTVSVYNMLGKYIVGYKGIVDKGTGIFTFFPGKERGYILYVNWRSETRAIKMFNTGFNGNSTVNLRYNGTKPGYGPFKNQKLTHQGTQNNAFLSSIPSAIHIQPYNATAYDELTLIFDPAEACFQTGSLAGVPTIGMHSGVTFSTGEIWQNVVEYNGTAVNGQQPQLIQTSDGRYSITFIPSGFYGLNDEVVTQLCVVFNNGNNWEQDGRDYDPETSDCIDFYIPLNPSHNFIFNSGDELRYTGFGTTPFGVGGSNVIEDIPGSSEFYEFEISEGIPCPGSPRVTYDGQTYNTVLIGSQCWFKENLNVGIKIDAQFDQANNGLIEKYCYDNNESICDELGGLYQWNEMMKYTISQGTRGVCPPGWKLPSDENWKKLEGTVDSQFDYPDPEWDQLGWRGFDAGLNLKIADGWSNNGNGLDSYGFKLIPGGFCNTNGEFIYLESHAFYWSSSRFNTDAWLRSLVDEVDGINRSFGNHKSSFSARCMKETNPQPWSCGDDFTDNRDGRTYSTVQVGDQCWMGENLAIGEMIDGATDQSDNNTIEKYCYGNDPDYCDVYGALYQWAEMMQYATNPGSQGICPLGWQLPKDEEWKQLEGTVDSQYGYPDPHWDQTGIRDFDAGLNLKSNDYWTNGGNGNDIYKFRALPGGYRNPIGGFNQSTINGFFWTSDELGGSAWGRILAPDSSGIIRSNQPKNMGLSVRCILD